MSLLFHISRNELKQVFKEPVALAPHFIIPLFFIGVFTLYYFLSAPEAKTSDFSHALVLLGVLGATTSLALCADSFAGERERNTLELLLSLPVPPSTLFWGKVLGLLPLPIAFGWLSQLGFIAAAAAINPALPGWMELGMCFLLTLFSAVFLISVCTMISLHVSTVRSAAQLSGLIAIFYLFLIQAVYFWFSERPLGLLLVLLFMGASGAVLLIGGKVRFEKGKVR